jgi:glutamate racemase
VIGTVGTVSSGAYARAVEATGADVALTAAACPGFVEFVERGETDGEQVTILAERLLAPCERPTSMPCCSAAPTTRTSPASSPT